MPQPPRCPDCCRVLDRFRLCLGCPADPANQRRDLVASGWTDEEAAEIPLAIYVPAGTVDYDPDAAAGK